MKELNAGPELVGRKVRSATRPEWGIGQVLRVQETVVDGRPVQRVSIQFAFGHRVVVVPPGRLIEPHDEPNRQAGWLDALAGRSLDDRLRGLPDAVTQAFGTLEERLMLSVPLFRYGASRDAILRWARDQTGVADPLAHWTRDELAEAFAGFCAARDGMVRNLIASLRRRGGDDALRDWISRLPEATREALLAIIDAR